MTCNHASDRRAASPLVSDKRVSQTRYAILVAAPTVNLFDDLQRPDSFVETGRRLAVELDVIDEGSHLERPRLIAARIFVNRRFRGAHFRQHLVVRESLHAVASSESVNRDFRVTTVNLEREQILPLGAAGVKPGGLAGGGAQGKERVVVDLHVPEVRCRVAFNDGKLAEEPARQVD